MSDNPQNGSIGPCYCLTGIGRAHRHFGDADTIHHRSGRRRLCCVVLPLIRFPLIHDASNDDEDNLDLAATRFRDLLAVHPEINPNLNVLHLAHTLSSPHHGRPKALTSPAVTAVISTYNTCYPKLLSSFAPISSLLFIATFLPNNLTDHNDNPAQNARSALDYDSIRSSEQLPSVPSKLASSLNLDPPA